MGTKLCEVIGKDGAKLADATIWGRRLIGMSVSFRDDTLWTIFGYTDEELVSELSRLVAMRGWTLKMAGEDVEG